MVAKPLCPLYKYIIKPLDRAYYPELRYYLCKNLGKRLSWNRSKNKHKITKKINNNGNHQPKREKFHHQPLPG